MQSTIIGVTQGNFQHDASINWHHHFQHSYPFPSLSHILHSLKEDHNHCCPLKLKHNSNSLEDEFTNVEDKTVHIHVPHSFIWFKLLPLSHCNLYIQQFLKQAGRIVKYSMSYDYCETNDKNPCMCTMPCYWVLHPNQVTLRKDTITMPLILTLNNLRFVFQLGDKCCI